MFCPQIFGKNTKKDKNANHFQITRLVKHKNLKSATYWVSWDFACKRQKFILLYIFLA